MLFSYTAVKFLFRGNKLECDASSTEFQVSREGETVNSVYTINDKGEFFRICFE